MRTLVVAGPDARARGLHSDASPASPSAPTHPRRRSHASALPPDSSGWAGQGWLAGEEPAHRRGVHRSAASARGRGVRRRRPGPGPGELYVWALCGDYRPGPGRGAVLRQRASGGAPGTPDRVPSAATARRGHRPDVPADVAARSAAARCTRRRPQTSCSTWREGLRLAEVPTEQLTAQQASEGGAAGGTFFTPVLVTNRGLDCELLRDDLAVWTGRPARSRALLSLTGAGPVV